MKKQYYIILFVIAACFTKCNKDISLEPIIFQPTTFATEEQLEAQLVAVYGLMNQEQMYAQGLWGYFATVTDEGFRTDAATGTTTQVFTESLRSSNSDATYATFWRLCYRGIEMVNVIIDNINKPVMNETKRKQILGQAVFMRAFYYYLLTSNFGDVVLKNTPTTQMGTTFNLPRTSSRVVSKFLFD
jgi:starch-binding outer membrane protein, SusD/RagB family